MSLCGFLVLDLLFETESSPIVVDELNKSLVQSLGFGQHFSSETFRKTPCSTLFASNQSFVFLQVHKGSIITSHCKCNVHILHSGHHWFVQTNFWGKFSNCHFKKQAGGQDVTSQYLGNWSKHKQGGVSWVFPGFNGRLQDIQYICQMVQCSQFPFYANRGQESQSQS